MPPGRAPVIPADRPTLKGLELSPRSTACAWRAVPLLLFCSANTLAADAAPATAAPPPADYTRKLDPTDFRTRFEMRHEFQALQGGAERTYTYPRLDYAFSKALQLRIETPFATYDPRSAGQPGASGAGDLNVRLAWRALRTPDYALIAGVETAFNTADDRNYGYGKNVVAPFGFMSFDVPRLRTTFFPGLQHYFSVSGDPARRDVNYTVARFFILTRWPGNFYTGIENALYVDHERNGRTGFTLETEVGRFLNRHVAVWGRPGVGLHGDSLPWVYNWNLEVGVRYLFD